MTGITKEQVEAALGTLDGYVTECDLSAMADAVDYCRTYIAQLEAQRQPVSDEKLRDVWEGIKSLIKSFEIQAECSKEDLHNNCPVASYYPIIETALSELEALRDASKWHPMDTAPKDGSYFMAWFEGAELPTDLCWNNGRWEDMEMREENHEGFFSDAFVWLPLPTPPAQEG